ncbi:MAG: TOPRIM nucleotidyl transferase/hydrolase domain-containing protein [Candidatus Dadabacteria bacterium]
MSDIESAYYDTLAEDYFAELAKEELFKESALRQCIYLFVEGKSEERAFPMLLHKAGLDIEQLGLVIANYHGSGNLLHCMRLMRRTLSHDRPIIITIDNDVNGVSFQNKYRERNVNKDYIFLVPQKPVVTFSNGHMGGSYEEIYPVSFFIDICFTIDIMPENILEKKNAFEKSFDPNKSWFGQIMKFSYKNGFPEFADKKVELAISLADKCREIPTDIKRLAELVSEVREKYPIEL